MKRVEIKKRFWIELLNFRKKMAKKNVYFLKNDKKLLKYQNKHKGQRCFIIGNGPSLTMEDLDKLKNEICFASNKIYLAFDKTYWRPKYYCTTDQTIVKNNIDKINKIIKTNKFSTWDVKTKLNVKFKDCLFIEPNRSDYYFFPPKPFKFSFDPLKEIYIGNTVTYFMIQLAFYMGFVEIYLLGVDFNYSSGIDVNGNYIEGKREVEYFDKDYMRPNEERFLPNLKYQYQAFVSAKHAAIKKGVKIYNATRGGKLEVFERVDFDKILWL